MVYFTVFNKLTCKPEDCSHFVFVNPNISLRTCPTPRLLTSATKPERIRRNSRSKSKLFTDQELSQATSQLEIRACKYTIALVCLSYKKFLKSLSSGMTAYSVQSHTKKPTAINERTIYWNSWVTYLYTVKPNMFQYFNYSPIRQ
jgi:hypothetical protein